MEEFSTCIVCNKEFGYYDNECQCDPICAYKTKCGTCNLLEADKKAEEKARVDEFLKRFLGE